MSSKAKPIEVVTRHYNDLIKYKEALEQYLKEVEFNSKEDFVGHFKSIIDSNNTDKIEEEVLNRIYKKQLAQSELGFYAYKFKRSCEFFLNISSTDLPENIYLEYQEVKENDNTKPYFIVESGNLKLISEELPISKEAISMQVQSIKEVIEKEGA